MGYFMLYHNLKANAALHSIDSENAEIILHLVSDTPPNLARDLTYALLDITGQQWLVKIHEDENAKTIYQLQKEDEQRRRDDIINSYNVQEILKTFTEITISDIKLK